MPAPLQLEELVGLEDCPRPQLEDQRLGVGVGVGVSFPRGSAHSPRGAQTAASNA